MERGAHFRMSVNIDCTEHPGPNTSVWGWSPLGKTIHLIRLVAILSAFDALKGTMLSLLVTYLATHVSHALSYCHKA